MSYIFDASAIVEAIKRFGEKAPRILWKNITLDLTYYELGNTIWREHALKKSISFEGALEKAQEAFRLLGVMRVERITTLEEFEETMRIASKLGLTFYDAAYAQKAKAGGLTLVTEDRKLLEKAGRVGVRATNTEHLAA